MMAELFATLIEMGVFASALFLLLRHVHFQKNKSNLTAKWRYGELKLVLLLYIVPFLPLVSLCFTAFPQILLPWVSLFSTEHTAEISTVVPSPPYEVTVYVPTEIPTDSITTAPPIMTIPTEKTVHLTRIFDYIPLFWGLGVLFSLFRLFYQWVRWKSLEKRAVEVEDKNIYHILDEEKEKLNLTKSVSIYHWDILETPILVGLFRKKILLPQMVSTPYGQIFRHELCHLKGKDVWWNLLLQVSILLHWYNPLIYGFAKLFREEMEYACDEMVGKTLDFTQKKRYCYALLESAPLVPEKTIYGLGFANDKPNIERRMIAMLQPKTMKTSTKIGATLLVTTLLMGAALPSAIDVGERAKISQAVEDRLLQVEGITACEADLMKSGYLYLKYVDTTRTMYAQENEDRKQELFKVASEVSGIHVLDMTTYDPTFGTPQKQDKELQKAMKEWDEIYEVHQYSYSPRIWDFMMEKVEKGTAEFIPADSEEQKEYWDLYWTIDRPHRNTSTMAGLNADNNNQLTYEQRTNILLAYNENGTGAVHTKWLREDVTDPSTCYAEVSFPSLEDRNTLLLTADGGVTWEFWDAEEYEAFDSQRDDEIYLPVRQGLIPEPSPEKLAYEEFLATVEGTIHGISRISYPDLSGDFMDKYLLGEAEHPHDYPAKIKVIEEYLLCGTGHIQGIYHGTEPDNGYFEFYFLHKDTGKMMVTVDGGVTFTEENPKKYEDDSVIFGDVT